ncbi:MAG TPA: tetratricopeptide repeat protein [Verrucomicrobiae bacterium]|nr:tetratricopeptide repeat protein [Verrucomicrobiae bacterium]
MDDMERRERARMLFDEAYRAQMDKSYDSAVDLYQKSIESFETPEAHTYLGWTYSHLNRLEDAIRECHRAIAVDPEFGNPYNDIGSYLMKQGKLEEAIGWFERAKGAGRYEPRHYPYLNLGRIYLATGRFDEAQREFAQARFVFESLVQHPPGSGAGAPN